MPRKRYSTEQIVTKLRQAEVELTREQIEKSTGESIPVTWIVRNESCETESGTTVVISEVEIKLRTANVIESTSRKTFKRGVQVRLT